MHARGPYHLIAASIGLFVAAAALVVLGTNLHPIPTLIGFVVALVAAVMGVIGMIAAGVSIGIRHAQVLTAEAFTRTT